ncbi:DUF418 domain-containing protein [Micromonospora sp. WMMD1102]|uniref:DUF418 domain-containing protein n=1 Tax=Micromonospora sp. WMMD1102 TaxID=3016105 RepID=UPI00241585B6|nr:DUF418 domain-containing protein [Micromonospora sp. WMMD1102]MDG4790611.1 DUF418 domain-containing protein [Micromonospora sp. WMMD1102]
MTTATAGTASRARIPDLDALRAFALLGILVVNIPFAATGYSTTVTDPAYDSWLDDAVRWLNLGFFGMKFYLLFSFMFGYSFVLQADAAARAGTAFRPRMVRRLLGLLALGAVNMVFLISGDILTVYALLGAVLLALRGIRDRTALVVAAALYGYLLLGLGASLLLVDTASYFDHASQVAAAQETTANLAGGFGSVVHEHVAILPLYGLSQLTVQGPTTLAMFLLGMVAARRRVLVGLTGRETWLRVVQLVGFPVGITGGVVYASIGGNGNTLGVLVSALTAPFLAAAYAATLVRVLHGDRGRWLGSTLAPAGRMALSNYLGQSVATLLIFTGVGFGLVGQVSPLEMLLFALAVSAGQLVVSRWWLARHGHGPVEWLLRWFTNAERPAWRRRQLNRPAG